MKHSGPRSPRDSLCDALKKHYLKVADRGSVFFPEMLEAIEAYRREPLIEAQSQTTPPQEISIEQVLHPPVR